MPSTGDGARADDRPMLAAGGRMETTRRDFVRAAGVAAGLVATGRAALAATAPRLATPPSTRRGDMLYRRLGRTGVEVSLIGLGGHHVGRPEDEGEAIALVRRAIDAGVTFMDN